MNCSTCGSPLIPARTRGMLTCPNGHGRLVPTDESLPTKTQQKRNAHRAWLNALPIATRLWRCLVDRRPVSVYRLAEHDGPCELVNWRETVDDSSTLRTGEVFARLNGTVYARRFVPVKLSIWQRERFSKGKETKA